MDFNNSLILQWGITPKVGNTNIIISFPISFKNNCYSVAAIVFSTTLYNEYGIQWQRNDVSSILMRCRAFQGNSLNIPLSYVCIGV